MTRTKIVLAVAAFTAISTVTAGLAAAAVADTMNDSLRQARGDIMARLPETDRIGGRQ